LTAAISCCGQYRYLLSRDDGIGRPAVFIMLNPSTADAVADDPTIRRCRSFAATWGRSGILVLNLYALRSTHPAGLWRHPDPVGPDNDAWLTTVAAFAGDVVCAWGANAKPDRVRQVVELLSAAGARMLCLGTTKPGAPRHPLYVPGAQPLEPWVAPR
jgi:hypothetical protein